MAQRALIRTISVVPKEQFYPKQQFKMPSGPEVEAIYFNRGKEQTALFVAGWALRLSCWKYQMRDKNGNGLFPGYNLLFVNNRGHGDIPINGSIPSTYLYDCAEDIRRLLHFLGMRRKEMHVVAHSEGALITAALSALSRFQFRSMTLVSPVLCNPLKTFPPALALGSTFDIVRRVISEETVVHFFKVFFSSLVDPRFSKLYHWQFQRLTGSAVSVDSLRKFLESIITVKTEVFDLAFKAMLEEGDKIGEKLREVQCPVLAVAGKQDFLVHASALQMLRRLVSHAETYVFDNTTHFTMAEMPHDFNMILAGFLADNSK